MIRQFRVMCMNHLSCALLYPGRVIGRFQHRLQEIRRGSKSRGRFGVAWSGGCNGGHQQAGLRRGNDCPLMKVKQTLTTDRANVQFPGASQASQGQDGRAASTNTQAAEAVMTLRAMTTGGRLISGACSRSQRIAFPLVGRRNPPPKQPTRFGFSILPSGYPEQSRCWLSCV